MFACTAGKEKYVTIYIGTLNKIDRKIDLGNFPQIYHLESMYVEGYTDPQYITFDEGEKAYLLSATVGASPKEGIRVNGKVTGLTWIRK